MIDGMQIKSTRGFERSSNNYRLKYSHHLSYWKNTRKTNHWITDENPLFSHQGKVLRVLSSCQKEARDARVMSTAYSASSFVSVLSFSQCDQ